MHDFLDLAQNGWVLLGEGDSMARPAGAGPTAKPNFMVPVLAGGGTRLPVHVGVLAALERLDISYEHIVGVSGGSIVAALVAGGKSLEEINSLALNVDFSQFKGYSPYQLLFYGGLSSGVRFENWLDQQLGGALFSDLQLNLHVIATDVQTGQPVVFDCERTPQVKVATAVRYSMGIPLLFSFRLYQDKVLVDGSILSEDALRRDWAGDGSPVCFFRIRSNGQQLRKNKEKAPLLPVFLAMLIRTFMTTLSREFVSDVYWDSTIVIDSGSVSPIEFSMSRQQRLELYQRGYATALQYVPEKFLKNRSGDC